MGNHPFPRIPRCPPLIRRTLHRLRISALRRSVWTFWNSGVLVSSPLDSGPETVWYGARNRRSRSAPQVCAIRTILQLVDALIVLIGTGVVGRITVNRPGFGIRSSAPLRLVKRWAYMLLKSPRRIPLKLRDTSRTVGTCTSYHFVIVNSNQILV